MGMMIAFVGVKRDYKKLAADGYVKMFDKYHDICHKMEPDYDTSEIPQTC